MYFKMPFLPDDQVQLSACQGLGFHKYTKFIAPISDIKLVTENNLDKYFNYIQWLKNYISLVPK